LLLGKMSLVTEQAATYKEASLMVAISSASQKYPPSDAA
jgi:hypothetical protein